MDNSQRYYTFFAGLSGFVAMVMGAAAAHKAQDAYAADLLRQASLYQLVHAVAILALSSWREWPARTACLLFAIGIILFCGGLCAKAFSGANFTGMFIPWGGGALMLGWLAAAGMAFVKKPDQGA